MANAENRPDHTVSIVNPRPSRSVGSQRTPVTANFSFQTINTTPNVLHTVTANKKFYLTDLIISVSNGNTADSVCSVRDNTTVKIPWISSKSVSSADPGQTVFTIALQEHMEFSTNVNVVSGNASGVAASVTIIGYEEDSDFY